MPSVGLLLWLSQAFGWIYFVAWSASFLPQLVLNYRRKSVVGFSPDFATTNPVGYFALVVFNASLFFSAAVRAQYAGRHHGGTPAVSPADVAFAIYAFTMASACYVQTWLYPAPASVQRLSTYNRLVLPLLALGIVTYGAVVWSGAFGDLQLLDWLLGFSYIKLYVTFTKYVPQAVLNHRRKSTHGWSVANILLDLTGAGFSLGQLALDAHLSGAFADTLFGNPSKLGMALFTLSFDLLFLVQHYVLYPHAKEADDADADADAAKPAAAAVVDERTPLV